MLSLAPVFTCSPARYSPALSLPRQPFAKRRARIPCSVLDPREPYLVSEEVLFVNERRDTRGGRRVQPYLSLLIGTLRRTDKCLAVAGHFFQVVAGLFVGEAFPQLIVDAGRLEAVGASVVVMDFVWLSL